MAGTRSALTWSRPRPITDTACIAKFRRCANTLQARSSFTLSTSFDFHSETSTIFVTAHAPQLSALNPWPTSGSFLTALAH